MKKGGDMENFTPIQNEITRSSRLDVYQKLCIINILSNDDNFKMSLNALAKRIPCSQRKVQQTIKGLKDIGVVSVKKVKTLNGDWDSNQYLINTDVLFKYIEVENDMPNVENDIHKVVHGVHNGREQYAQQVENDMPTKNTKKNTNIENNIYSHWNSKEIIVHKSLTKDMEKVIEKALKKYSDNEIVQAIDTYSEILESDFYFNYKWSLVDFLNRKNGISTFMEEGSNKANYDEYLNKKSKEKNNSTEKPKEIHLRGWD